MCAYTPPLLLSSAWTTFSARHEQEIYRSSDLESLRTARNVLFLDPEILDPEILVCTVPVSITPVCFGYSELRVPAASNT